MKNKVKYTHNRNYRDFEFEMEDEPTANIVNKFKTKKKSKFQKFKDILKSFFNK